MGSNFHRDFFVRRHRYLSCQVLPAPVLLEELPEDSIGVEVLRAFAQYGEDGLFAGPSVAAADDFVELDLAVGIGRVVNVANDVGSIGVGRREGFYCGRRLALVHLCPCRKGFGERRELGFGKALLADATFQRREIIVRAVDVADGNRTTGGFHRPKHGASNWPDGADAICYGAGQRVGHHRAVGKARDEDLARIDGESFLQVVEELLQISEVIDLLLGGMAVEATDIPAKGGA